MAVGLIFNLAHTFLSPLPGLPTFLACVAYIFFTYWCNLKWLRFEFHSILCEARLLLIAPTFSLSPYSFTFCYLASASSQQPKRLPSTTLPPFRVQDYILPGPLPLSGLLILPSPCWMPEGAKLVLATFSAHTLFLDIIPYLQSRA